MEIPRPFSYPSSHLLVFLTLFIISGSNGQVTRSEIRILFQIQKLLEYPQVLEGWRNWTNFCNLPPTPSLVIVCSSNHITRLAIVGNGPFASPSQIPYPKPSSGKILSQRFSIDSLFTTVTKLSHLKTLSLVSLGIWGPLPAKIDRLVSLEALNLSSNHINGSVPDLRGLAVLRELDLGGNHLGGKFPTLGRSLVTIILRNNSLRSEVPEELNKFDRIRYLDISSNRLVGPIPVFLFSLPSIESLNLGGNELTGAIPASASCSHELKFIDISKNLLIGKLPSCIGSRGSNRTVFYSWNCLSSGNLRFQHPYGFCYKEALAVKPTIKEEEESSIKLGIVLGIVGGCIGAVGVLGLLILLIFRRLKAKKAEGSKFDALTVEKGSFHSYPKQILGASRVPRTMRSAALGLPQYHVLTLEEIEDATNNFDQSNLMGEESQGHLYKGSLRNGALVLVKCLELNQRHSPQSLSQYVEVISKLRHQNLVSVLGHCFLAYEDYPASTVFIILEDIPNGSLKDHLADGRKREMLKWPQRMAITLGIARGLHFLHAGIAPGIFGSDLQIEKIKLDENLTPKISNYKIPSPSKVGSESPLNGRSVSHMLGSVEDSEKNDVYQLGRILVELVTGRLLSSDAELYDLINQLESSLAEAPSVLRAAADSAIRGTFAYQSLRTTVEIAINCLSKDPGKRPSMEDVIWNLQYSFQVQEGWTSSENLGTRP